MKYKIEFEVVPAMGEGSKFYLGSQPNCKPEDVPDDYWHKTSRETNDCPKDQYNTLKEWSENGTQLIRSVNLFESSGDIKWNAI